MLEKILPKPESIRAARAYLGISQGELASHCNISRTSIASIENKTFNAKHDTLESIQRYFWTHGIDFLPDGGFKTTGLVEILEGDDGVRNFFGDVLMTAETVGGEFLVSGMDELEFYNILKKVGIGDDYDTKMQSIGNVSYRVLTGESTKENLVYPYAVPYASYKVMPDNQISSDVPFYIYGDKLAILLKKMAKIIIIKDCELVEAYRRMFDTMWNSEVATNVYT